VDVALVVRIANDGQVLVEIKRLANSTAEVADIENV
jgi:hypothetical protein